jgi:hypothetical protein
VRFRVRAIPISRRIAHFLYVLLDTAQAEAAAGISLTGRFPSPFSSSDLARRDFIGGSH